MKTRNRSVAFLLTIGLALHAGAAQQPNPALPQGRLEKPDFFNKYPVPSSWTMVSEFLLPNDDFGVRKAGEKIQNGWIVAAKGSQDGLNHKTYKGPQAVLVCTVPSKVGKGQELLIQPDGGCG